MTSVQKIIKYLATAFAIFLSVSIIGGIITALSGISFILSDKDKKEPVGEMTAYPVSEEISSLQINLSAAELIIRNSDNFSVESNHNYITVETNNGKLIIDETETPISIAAKGVTVILNVPENFIFDDVELETGAGHVKIDTLAADVLDITFGAGEAEIESLTANSRAQIDGGVGEITIKDGLLRNLDLDMGVGELTLTSRLEGESDLDYGVGETNLTLLGSPDEYKIKLDKGIGEAKLQGEDMNDDSVYGGGTNRIEIDGGIGELKIEFEEYKTDTVI